VASARKKSCEKEERARRERKVFRGPSVPYWTKVEDQDESKNRLKGE